MKGRCPKCKGMLKRAYVSIQRKKKQCWLGTDYWYCPGCRRMVILV